MKQYFTYSLKDVGHGAPSLIAIENETDNWNFVSNLIKIKSNPNFYKEAHEEASFYRIYNWMSKNHPELLL